MDDVLRNLGSVRFFIFANNNAGDVVSHDKTVCFHVVVLSLAPKMSRVVSYESAVFYRSKNRQFTRCQPQLQESNARNVYAPTKECNEKVRTWDIYD